MSDSTQSGTGAARPPSDAAPGDRRDARQRAVAVALHRPGADAAGARVVASGRGAVAEQILALAFAHDVRVREDADLAEVLAAVEVDSEIPLEALAAVAEILSYVYRANAAATAAATHPPEGEPAG